MIIYQYNETTNRQIFSAKNNQQNLCEKLYYLSIEITIIKRPFFLSVSLEKEKNHSRSSQHSTF